MDRSLTDQLTAIRHAIDRFMGQLDRNPSDGEEGLRSLALSLDHLVAIYFETEDIEPAEEGDAPAKDNVEFYKRASQAFPELGLYPYADPGGEPSEEDCLVADAIGDIGDIAGDLSEVLWHLDSGSAANAIWEFRFGYQHHWGDHLHSLRNYLHSSRIAAW